MKNIKFRMWHKEEKEMIDGDSLAFELYAPLVDLLNQNGIMQYIGMKDKNDVEVYEGDIVLFPDTDDGSTEWGYDWVETMSIGLVQWNDEGLRFDVTKRSSIDMDSLIECFDKVQVIGNICENPELLEMDVEDFYASRGDK